MQKTTLAAIVLLTLAAMPAFSQKGAGQELGFNPAKLYHFTNIDSVNLFNGNLVLTVPFGPAYHVSSSLSYQFTLVYNGKMWDYETYDCPVPGPPGPIEQLTRCTDAIANRRSNAGVGWRLSFGRLLPPTDLSIDHSTDDRDRWIYESPAGDEHAFSEGSVGIAVDTSALRLVTINAPTPTRDVEFPSGERHRFVWERQQWRLTQMLDRFGNWVLFTYSQDPNDYLRDAGLTVTDSVGREQVLVFTHWSDMNESVDRGQNIQSLMVKGFGGAPATYNFYYDPLSTRIADGTTNRVILPMLTRLLQPDGTDFLFSYNLDPVGDDGSQGTLKWMKFPTGGTVEYNYQFYVFAAQQTCGNDAFVNGAGYGADDGRVGIRRRTISDGATQRIWDYVQRRSPDVPAEYPDSSGDYCCVQTGASHPLHGPFYWSRTSVLSPEVTESGMTTRTRTDHYFNILSFDFPLDGCPSSVPQGEPRLLDSFNVTDSQIQFGYAGTVGMPPPATAKGPLVVPEDTPGYPADISAIDSAGRFLTTQTYTGCTSAGDCTNGVLQRSLYSSYEAHPLAWYWCTFSSGGCGSGLQLKSSRTIFHDDLGCGGACYTETTYTDNNGAGLYRTVTQSSNFPNTTSIVSATAYQPWTAAAVVDPQKAWITGLYTETSRSQGGSATRSQFCFNESTGFLNRQRVLAGQATGTTDVLSVFSPNSHGDVQFVLGYGGEKQPIGTGTGTDLCSLTLPSAPWYKVENAYDDGTNGYAGSVLAWSRYYDRVTQQPLAFRSFDRSIDRHTGVATASRDTAGVATAYSYDAVPARLHTMTTPAGAVTTYLYTIATGSPGAAFTPAKVDVSTVAVAGTLGSQFVFDGLGKVIRSSTRLPAQWSAAETTYDGEGRVLTVSEPESTGASPPTGPLVALNKTTYRYDGLGRPLSITVPDGSRTDFGYVGERLKTRTSGIWNGVADSLTPVTEEYDAFGRLVTVTEKSGPTTAASVIGSDVVTTYGYDSGNRLRSVKMGASTGPVQNRLFDYDGRGFLRWESQPESGITSYEYDAGGHVVSKTQSAANSLFDLKFTYDHAERPTLIEGRNPFYDPASPTSYQPQFRPLKEFTYENNANNGSDLRLGKLTRATRHNYGELISESDFEVSDAYEYTDTAGRKTKRTTSITEVTGGVGGPRWPVRDIMMSMEYNDLDLPAKMRYPGCIDCGLPPSDPDRYAMTRTYGVGWLKSLSGYVSDITYWPNGMRNVLLHTNGIADTQVATNMPRPSQMSFGVYDRCVRPSFATQPLSGEVAASGDGFPLSVSMNGTGPFTYEWRNAANWTLVGTTASITVNPTATTEYFVDVTGPCGHEQSQKAKVTVGQCATPSTGVIQAVLQPDGSWILKPNPEARSGRTFNWTRPPDTNSLGTSETLAVGVLSATTTYHLTVTDACGTGGGDVTINVPLPTTSGLDATAAQSLNQVSVTWPAIAGATQYTVQRRSGTAWETVGTTTAPSFNDTTVAASRTYAYHVTSNNGGSTNYDVATTMSFTPAVSGQVITAAPANDMLNAANKVRGAAGWPALTWSNILAASDPLPAPGSLILARHIMSCRARMNEALQALGVRILPYANADLAGDIIYAADINEVQQRTQ